MGTWGTGPLDSDTAEDFLDELERRPVSQRVVVVERTLRAGIEVRANSAPSVLPEEIIAAAAVVAANVPAGRSLVWPEEYSSIAEWLVQPVPPTLAAMAVEALEATLSENVWFWNSWVDADEREDARAAIDSLRFVLRSVARGDAGSF